MSSPFRSVAVCCCLLFGMLVRALSADVQFILDHREVAIEGSLGGGAYQHQQVASASGLYESADFLHSLADSLQAAPNSIASSANMTSIAQMPVADYGTVFALGNASASLNLQSAVTAAGAGTSTFDMTFQADALIRLFLQGTYQVSGGGNFILRLNDEAGPGNPILLNVQSGGQPAGNYSFNEVLSPGTYRWLAVAAAHSTTTAPPVLSSNARFQFNGVMGSAADLNLDSQIDCEDIDALVAQIAAGTHEHFFDLTGDGLVNLDDRDTWLDVAGALLNASRNPILLGDANLDGVVDGQDFINWNDHKFMQQASWCSGDFDANGIIDGADFIEWNLRKFTSSDGGAARLAVPEPSLFSLGCWLMLLAPGLRCCYRGTKVARA